MIYIVRHGETDLNKDHRLQGRSDGSLNENGIRQAKALRDAFRRKGIAFDSVFSSPLLRAVETAKIIAGTMPIRIDERLTEMNYGPYEGTDLFHLPEELQFFFSDFIHHPAPAGMEQLSEVVERTGQFLEDLKGMKGNILISTHAIAMKGILENLMADSHGSWWNRYVKNTAVFEADNSGETIQAPKEFLF